MIEAHLTPLQCLFKPLIDLLSYSLLSLRQWSGVFFIELENVWNLTGGRSVRQSSVKCVSQFPWSLGSGKTCALFPVFEVSKPPDGGNNCRVLYQQCLYIISQQSISPLNPSPENWFIKTKSREFGTVEWFIYVCVRKLLLTQPCQLSHTSHLALLQNVIWWRAEFMVCSNERSSKDL